MNENRADRNGGGLISDFIDLFLHLDDHLKELLEAWGSGWVYVVLTAIIFAETGLVFAAFLPGDSLLFAAGSFAGAGLLNVWLLLITLTIAAIAGDQVNYLIGKYLGPRMLRSEKNWLLNRKHLDRTHQFFERYGAKTIVLARFVPIVRTAAPFVAGVGRMSYGKFVFYNVFGGVIWVFSCVGAGYAFGQWQFVKENFSLVILAVIFVSVLPMGVEIIRAWMANRRGAAAAVDAGSSAPPASSSKPANP
jgi:membrane-associated protein